MYDRLAFLRLKFIYAIDVQNSISMIRMAIAYNKKDKTVTTEIAQVLLNILVGVLTAVIAVLNTIPTSKEVTDIINTIRDIIILIQDALNNPTLWTK